MASAADDDRDDVFDVATSLVVRNLRLGIDVSIHPTFLKVIDDTQFVSLDFYRSRGVYSLLTSRLPQQQLGTRQYSKLLAKVVGGLKQKRDEAFRQSVLLDATCHNLSFGKRSLMPKNKVLKASVMAMGDVIAVEVDAFEDEFDGFRLTCVVPIQRQNGNTELQVDSQGGTWNYLSKLVAHEHRRALDAEGTPPVDSPSMASAPIAVEHGRGAPIGDARSPKRHARTEDAAIDSGVSPSKKQMTLLTFMKPSP